MLRSFGGHPIRGSILSTVSAYEAKNLGQVYESQIERLVLFSTLLLYLAIQRKSCLQFTSLSEIHTGIVGFIKPIVLWGFRSRCRRPCLSSIMTCNPSLQPALFTLCLPREILFTHLNASNAVSVVCSVVLFDSISVPVEAPMVNVTAQSSTSIAAFWELPNRYTKDKDFLSFKLLYQSRTPLRSDRKNTLTVKKGFSTVVTGLEKFTEYEFKVWAFSSVADGPKSSSKVARTLEDGKRLKLLIRLMNGQYGEL